MAAKRRVIRRKSGGQRERQVGQKRRSKPGRSPSRQHVARHDISSPSAILTLQRTLGNQAVANAVQAMRDDKAPAVVKGKMPANHIGRKKRNMHLDFVRMKRKKIHWARILLPASLQSKKKRNAEGGTYGHWWTEIGDLTGDKWKSNESYGWWPDKDPNIAQTFQGVKGSLNQGGGIDPHHGEKDAPTVFHPVAQVDDAESYDQVRERILTDLRAFAKGYKGKWSWFFGWGKNCHTFQTKMMNKAGLKKKKARAWLRRPENALSMKQQEHIAALKGDQLLGEKATDMLQNSADIETVAKAESDFLANVSKLPHRYLEAMWNLMGITEAELKHQLIKQGILFQEDQNKYPSAVEERVIKAGTKLMATTEYEGLLQEITIPEDTKFRVMANPIYVMMHGRCEIKGGGNTYWVPVRSIFGDR